jgi:hypothetical protein
MRAPARRARVGGMLKHLAAAGAALALPVATAGAKPIPYDLTISASSQASYSAASTPYDKDCSHHQVWRKESGEETWSMKTPRAFRVFVDSILGTVTFPGTGAYGVMGAAQLRGQWTRTIKRSSGSSPGPCGGDGATIPQNPTGCGTKLPEQAAWMSFTTKTATLRVDYPQNLDDWGDCRFYNYPADFPHAPSVETLAAKFTRARLMHPGRKPIRIKADESYPAKTTSGGMNVTVRGSAKWEAVFTPAR